MPKFEIIQGTPAPDTESVRRGRRIRHAAPAGDVLECPRCAGRELVELVSGVRLKGGKPTSAASTFVCAACWLRGQRVTVR